MWSGSSLLTWARLGFVGQVRRGSSPQYLSRRVSRFGSSAHLLKSLSRPLSPRRWRPVSCSGQMRTRHRDCAYFCCLRFGNLLGRDDGSGAHHDHHVVKPGAMHQRLPDASLKGRTAPPKEGSAVRWATQSGRADYWTIAVLSLVQMSVSASHTLYTQVPDPGLR